MSKLEVVFYSEVSGSYYRTIKSSPELLIVLLTHIGMTIHLIIVTI